MENVKEISKVEIKKVFWAPCGYLINFLNHLEPSEWTYLLYFFGFKLIGCFFFDILLKPYPCTRSQLPPTPTKVSARIHDFSWKIRLVELMLVCKVYDENIFTSAKMCSPPSNIRVNLIFLWIPYRKHM